ncbi:MAG TPA: ankyrin repeat domain-containing protein [Nitrospirota bacterium]|nr:ankyrin repeat domain-containing protein [Nitrospirota bacterium]
MKSMVVILLAVLTLSPQLVFGSQSTVVEAQGSACMGEDKSRKQTEEAAMAEAKKKAVETVSTHVQSETDVKNFTFEKDRISSFANAEVKVLKEIDKRWYKDPALGDCYRVRIKAEVIPEAVGAGRPGGPPAIKPERAELERRGVEYKTENFIKAIKDDNTDIAELFIKAGIDVNAVAEEGNAPALIIAILKGNVRVSKAIISAGANLNTADGTGMVPLEAATIKNLPEVVRGLISGGADVRKDGPDTLIIASRWGYTEIVKDLLQAGVGTTGEKGVKAMSLAADFGHTAVVKLLLEKGAQVNAKDFAGYNPLARAAESNQKETVLLLIERGGDINNRDNYGMTPLMRAIQYGRTEMVTLLLDKGADKNVKDNQGKTALMWAVRENQPDALRSLVKAKADSSATDNEGQTAMSLAQQKKDQMLIDILSGK